MPLSQSLYNFGAPGTAYTADPAVRLRAQENVETTLLSGRVFNYGKEQYNPPASGNSATFKLQDSEDGVTWADVAGSEKTVKPLGEVPVSARVRKYVQVLAFGNTACKFTVDSTTPHVFLLEC